MAWLDARHPGRVGLGVGSGALALDFEAMGVPLEEATARFKAELPRVVDMLRGRDLRGLDGDRAFQRCAEHPIPVLSAAVSVTAAKRAARVGAGILMEGMSTVERLAELCRAFDETGGTESKVLVRRVWLGRVHDDLVAKQRAVYDSVSDRPQRLRRGPDPGGRRRGRAGGQGGRRHGPVRDRCREPPGPPARLLAGRGA